MDAPYAIFVSMPNYLNQSIIVSPYQAIKFPSLAQVLTDHQYDTSFFHGAKTGTMYFDIMCQLLGFEHYYGLEDYPNKKDFDGTWGIFDEPYLEYVSKS